MKNKSIFSLAISVSLFFVITNVYAIDEITILQKRIESLEARVSYLETKIREISESSEKKESGLKVEDYQGKEMKGEGQKEALPPKEQEKMQEALKGTEDLKEKIKERDQYLNELMEE